MAICYIGIGSNLGDRKKNIKKALKLLEEIPQIKLEKVSSFYETSPKGCPAASPSFLNAALKIKTSASPFKLLKELQDIEKRLGRIRAKERNSPRPIDLDILFFGNKKINTPALKIPHPRLGQRAFVLKPLKEIAPRLIKSLAQETKIISDISQIRAFIAKIKAQGRSVGLVATMGFLHEGHLSLIRQAKRDADICVVSIFVNPLQFGPKEDYKKYPRDLSQDSILAKSAGADCIFYPRAQDMYPQDYLTYVTVEKITECLCGESRPGHFKGVATVVAKLFNIISPDIAYFGQKDYQQVLLIKKMAQDLNMSVKIKVMPIVREADGLALSSRNSYLTTNERQEAVILHQSLRKAKKRISQGENRAKEIICQIKKEILKKKSAKIDYIAVVNPQTLEPVREVKTKALVALAVWFGQTRLIDNIIV